MFALNLLRRQAKGINRTFYTKAKFKDGGEHATFNDMPIPEGCWKENHSRKQNRYMMVLLSGIGSFIGATVLVLTTGDVVLNFTVPDYPYKDEEE